MLPHHVKPIYFEGSEHGVLLLHGFTATSDCMAYLAQQLNRAKFSVSAPLLAGHGTHYQDLEKTSWQDWYQSAEVAFQELKARCKTVMVLGLSMGGLLAVHLCQRHRQAIRAAALLATPLFLDGFLIKALFPFIWKTPLKHLYRYQSKVIVSIKDPYARKHHLTYDKIPLASVAALLDLQKTVREELRHFHQPLLLIHSLHDSTVSYSNMDYIKAMVASKEIKTVTLKKSDHIITVDYEKDRVAREVIRFFGRYV